MLVYPQRRGVDRLVRVRVKGGFKGRVRVSGQGLGQGSPAQTVG